MASIADAVRAKPACAGQIIGAHSFSRIMGGKLASAMVHHTVAPIAEPRVGRSLGRNFLVSQESIAEESLRYLLRFRPWHQTIRQYGIGTQHRRRPDRWQFHSKMLAVNLISLSSKAYQLGAFRTHEVSIQSSVLNS